MEFEEDLLERALETLGSLLERRRLAYEIVVIGGGALLLHGIIDRPTKDLDVLALVRHGVYESAQPLPGDLEQAVSDVAVVLRLAPDWLNAGPAAQLSSGLPEGFEGRVDTRTYGTLVVHIAGRIDLLYLKVYAAASEWPAEGKHAADLRRLRPTRAEFPAAARWARSQDVSQPFGRLLVDMLRAFGVDDAET